MTSIQKPFPSVADKRHIEIQISGFGGQGVVLAASIIGRAAVDEGRNAVMIQSYGPESRGGASLAALIIDDDRIGYPRVTDPDLIVVLSTAAYEEHGRRRPRQTVLIAEEDLIELHPEDVGSETVLTLPATRIADELGRRIVMNIVVLGFLCGGMGLLSAETLKRLIAASVPAHTEQLNMKAFDAGMQYGIDLAQRHGKTKEARR
jgi:2-oxoglutarate ferredoxin oxidoreductase subunit gamma